LDTLVGSLDFKPQEQTMKTKLVLWTIAIRMKLREERNERKRQFLGEMLAEFYRRLSH